MDEIYAGLPAVAAAHAAGAAEWTAGGVRIRRLSGGFNNALYHIEVAGQSYACKLFVPDERRRAEREYGLMRLLQAAGLDIAPEALLLDESCAVLPYPALVYRWLSGTPLGPRPTGPQLRAFLAAYQDLHSLQRGDFGEQLPTAWFHWFDWTPYLAELDGFLQKYGGWLATTGSEGREWTKRLRCLVQSCRGVLLGAAVDIRQQAIPLRLCRIDHNLDNALWAGNGRLRFVDWEYSGWGDPAMDLCDLRWHTSLTGLSPEQHAWLREHYVRPAGDDAFETRLALWDRFVVTRWPFLVLRWWWSLENGPDRLRLSQPAADPAELRARLGQLIERAEAFVQSTEEV